MKRRISAALLALLLVVPMAGLAAQPYGMLTYDDYQAYYELSDELCGDFDTSADRLLERVAPFYDMTVEELWDFIYYAVESDANHVWVPAHGGKRYHWLDTCSSMKDPRPTTIEDAYDMGFTPCKRCNPPK